MALKMRVRGKFHNVNKICDYLNDIDENTVFIDLLKKKN